MVLHFINKGKALSSLQMTNVMSLHEGVILEHAKAKCHVYTLKPICELLCNISIHLMTLLNILMPIY